MEEEGEESSILLILAYRPVGGSSVGGRLSAFLKNESRFDCVCCSICVRCSILILLIKTVRYSIVRRSIPHCTLYVSTTLISPNTNLDILFSEDDVDKSSEEIITPESCTVVIFTNVIMQISP